MQWLVHLLLDPAALGLIHGIPSGNLIFILPMLMDSAAGRKKMDLRVLVLLIEPTQYYKMGYQDQVWKGCQVACVLDIRNNHQTWIND